MHRYSAVLMVIVTVILLPGFAQDVLMESDTEEYELLRVENTGSYVKTGINISNTNLGLNVSAISTGVQVDIYDTDETYMVSGVNSFATDYDAYYSRAFYGDVSGGNYSSVSGLQVTAGGGNDSYVVGVSSSVYGGSGSTLIAGYFDGELHYGSLHEISDQKFKRNIRDLPNGVVTIMALRPRLYEMKTEEFKDKLNLPQGEQIGFVAQEVEGVLPQLVSDAAAPARLTREEQKNKVKKQPTKYKALDYTGMIPVLVKAMQEQQALIEALQAEVATLKK
jgi:hypothetical protein